MLKGAFCGAIWCCGAERVSHEQVIRGNAANSKQGPRNRKIPFCRPRLPAPPIAIDCCD